MSVAIRYYSRSGSTKAVAEAIAKAAGTDAISVDAKDSALTTPVDVLFVGGALYAYGLDNNLKKYLESIDGSMVKKAVVFSTSWVSKHANDLIKDALQKKGIAVEEEAFYCKSKPKADTLDKAAAFAKKYV